jgi:hypothetical protein
MARHAYDYGVRRKSVMFSTILVWTLAFTVIGLGLVFLILYLSYTYAN